MDEFYSAFKVQVGFCYSKWCRVPQFGGDGYQVAMKPIEPLGYLVSETKFRAILWKSQEFYATKLSMIM